MRGDSYHNAKLSKMAVNGETMRHAETFHNHVAYTIGEILTLIKYYQILPEYPLGTGGVKPTSTGIGLGDEPCDVYRTIMWRKVIAARHVFPRPHLHVGAAYRQLFPCVTLHRLAFLYHHMTCLLLRGSHLEAIVTFRH
jgi:hypothetical protein